MQILVQGRNIEVTTAIRNYIEKKLGKLRRFSDDLIKAEVVVSIEKNWHKVEVTLRGDGLVARGEERSNDMYASIDTVVDKLERQLKRFKEKLQRKARGEKLVLVEEPPIVRRKSITLEVMDEGEAIDQMELLGHDFFLFKNTRTGKIALVYRRRGEGYGLIEVE